MWAGRHLTTIAGGRALARSRSRATRRGGTRTNRRQLLLGTGGGGRWKRVGVVRGLHLMVVLWLVRRVVVLVLKVLMVVVVVVV